MEEPTPWIPEEDQARFDKLRALYEKLYHTPPAEHLDALDLDELCQGKLRAWLPKTLDSMVASSVVDNASPLVRLTRYACTDEPRMLTFLLGLTEVWTTFLKQQEQLGLALVVPDVDVE